MTHSPDESSPDPQDVPASDNVSTGRGPESGTAGSPSTGAPEPGASEPGAQVQLASGAAASASTSPDEAAETATSSAAAPDAATADPSKDLARTRAAAAWFATGAGLVVLVLLIILILQNQDVVEVRYLWFSGSLPLGTALLIAAVAGAAIVMLIGIVRLTQLRLHSRRQRKSGRRPGAG